MLRADGERWGSFLVAFAALLVAATCSRESRLEPKTPALVKKTAAPLPATPALPPPSPAPSLIAPPVVAEPPLSPQIEALGFERLDRALAELEAKTRTDHVRILWLGDSHTAADFLTGAVRRKLSLRFGAGGPGLLRLGAGPYRHEGVKMVRDGRWRVEPEPPSRRNAEGDTAFGYAGLRAIPLDARARVEARVSTNAVRGDVRYEVLFDLPHGASFLVTVGEKKTRVDARTRVSRVSGSPILRVHFQGTAKDGFEISGITGSPRFYGVIAEGTEPGLVLDTSGIDGARIATALAWNPEALAAELRARPPDLFVIAYGTNEAFDKRRAELIGTELGTLMERLRAGAPQADCLVVGPPDAALPDFTSMPRVVEIEGALYRAALRLGCRFFPLRVAMGGDGGFARWLRRAPPLARGDRIHLLPAGYEELGDGLASAFITAYEARALP